MNTITSIIASLAALALSVVALFSPAETYPATTIDNDPTVDTTVYNLDGVITELQSIYGNDKLVFICHTERYEGSSELATAWVDPKNPNEIHLLSRLCSELEEIGDYITQDEPRLRTWVVLNIINHEGVHTTGIYDEYITECRSLNTTDVLARALGMPEDNIVVLQQKYYDNVYVGLHREGYYDEDCVPTF